MREGLLRVGLRRRTWAWAGCAVVALGLVLGWWRAHPGRAQGVARPAAAGTVHALARLEPESGLIVVGVRPGARLEAVAVREGERVEKGATLAVIEGHEAALAQLALAEAQRKQARDQRGRRREKAALERALYDATRKVKLSTARRLAEIARQRLDEINNLAKSLTALQNRDKVELEQARFAAEAQRSQAEANREEVEAADGLTGRQRDLEDRQLADKGGDDVLLDRQVEAAGAVVGQTVVKAPASGQVLAVVAHAGEVSAGPLLYLGDLAVMVAKAEVDQAEVPRVRAGDPADVVIQGKPVAGKVTRVSGMVVPNQMRDVDPRALQDLRVIRVTIRLDDGAEASRYVNMQVEATIRPRPAVGK